MLPIHMGGHQDLTAGEESLRQFQTDLMGLGGSEVFFRGEGLGVLVEEGAGVFPVEVFGGHEALHGHICHTVDARQVAVAFLVHGFLWLGYILWITRPMLPAVCLRSLIKLQVAMVDHRAFLCQCADCLIGFTQGCGQLL